MISTRQTVFVIAVLGGCATASSPDRQTADGNDSKPPPIDSSSGTATNCTPMTDILMNGAFDSMPVGMAWSGTPANALYPIITSNGLTAQSAPDKAWMGSVVSATDEMHEDVAVPMKATGLVIAGFYQVRTTETGTAANDTAKLEIDDSNDTMLEVALTLDNTASGTTWVPFSHTLTSSVAGKTARLRFTTANNSTKATSFYFDTISLTVTGCQ